MSKFISPEIQKLLHEITNESDLSRIFSLWSYNREKLEGLRLLTNLENYSSKIIPEYIKKTVFEGKSKVFVQEFYKSENLFALSNEILDKHQSSASLAVPIDYSLLLDSNYVGSADLFLRGISLGNNHEAFTKSIHHITQNKINCDALPYLLENAEHITERMNDVKRTFANFLRITSATPKGEHIHTIDDLEFSLTEAESLSLADQRIQNFFGDKEILQHQISRQKIDFYLILSIIHIEHQTKGSLEEKFLALIKIMHTELPGIALRELAIAYKYFKNNNSIFILANVGKLIKEEEDALKAIRNISWDFHFFRLMETWASDTSKGAFFIPIFVTLDKRLANLNEIHPIKYSVFHDTERKMYTAPTYSIKDQIDNKACRLILEEYFTTQKINHRSQTKHLSPDAIEERITQKGSDLNAVF
ncbi:hypothetical protein OU997_05615 [Pseudomonas sp. SL4(2022)]|uniref:hypothetical protein n=1 Tax=Pseudomonas sp. SL4(2022) TaxID=2994661 RepID=UPI0022704055|nr:hypothetical protein [Pseudomonas sp. SL4(2022)]WAC45648.1 hypothetical protein OU997_05615 [Pseudomonas sp. SL4(2022)]